jgi:hypothetical protein
VKVRPNARGWRGSATDAGFFDDVAEAGLYPELLLSAWDIRPFTEDSDFLVAILGRK